MTVAGKVSVSCAKLEPVSPFRPFPLIAGKTAGEAAGAGKSRRCRTCFGSVPRPGGERRRTDSHLCRAEFDSHTRVDGTGDQTAPEV